MRVEIPITGGFYLNRSLPISHQECKNLYVHINDGGGLAPASLFGTGGIEQLATAGNALYINRGAHVMDGIPYFVNGGYLYSLDRSISGTGIESFSVTNLGAISGSGRVSMSDNGTQLMVLVAGTPSVGYIYNNSTGVFTQITDVDFTANGNPQFVDYIDGYFVLTTDEKKFIISALNDGLSYDALDFGSAEADPDKIVAPIVVNNQLYICGSQTIELFRNAAAETGAAFPFVRVSGGSVSIGVFSGFSLIEAASTFFFVGGDVNDKPRIFAYNGGSPVAVSTDGIDYLLEQLTDTQLGAIFAWTYTEQGETFVAFTLPDRCVVYGVKAQKWHERSSYAVTNGVGGEFRYRVNSLVKAYNRILVGDSTDGRIGELSLNYMGEYGNDILSGFSTVPFSNQGKPIKVAMIEVTTESGVGNTDVSDPQIVMERSVDGKTWTDGRSKSLGKLGEYNKRQIWYRNGRAARFEVFRWRISDQVKKVLIKAEADIF